MRSDRSFRVQIGFWNTFATKLYRKLGLGCDRLHQIHTRQIFTIYIFTDLESFLWSYYTARIARAFSR